MDRESQKSLRNIVQVVYCDIGEKKLEQFIKLIKLFCHGQDIKEVLKIIKQEKKRIDKSFEEYYSQYDIGLVDK